MKKLSLSLLSAMSFATIAVAQTTAPAPVIDTYNNGYIILGITPNGKYAFYENRLEDVASGGRIVNLETNEVTTVTTTQATDQGSVADVTNDGKLAVGTFKNKGAMWSKDTQTWTNLPTKSLRAISASANAVTADGKYAVGREMYGEYAHGAVLWDLTTQKTVTLNNLPTLDLSGENQDQNSFINISADGRYIFGVLSFCDMNNVNYYVYDRETETVDYIGFEYDGDVFLEKATGLHHVDNITVSPSGNYVTGTAITTSDSEYAFRYNVLTKEFEMYNSATDTGILGYGIDDNGNIYGATPASSPLRDIYIRSGKYWYEMTQILQQRYGINFSEATGLDYTGTPVAISPDGSFIGAFSDPQVGQGCNYLFKEDVHLACESVDLLGNYTFSPTSNSQFSSLAKVTINFDRNVSLADNDKTIAQLLDKDGNLVRNSMNISTDGSAVTITFRATTLTEGEKYTVKLPAGAICMATDADVKSKEISVDYYGRKNAPVAANTIYPTPNTAVSKLDYNTSYIVLYFDSNIKVTDDEVTAKIYRNDETEAYETLSLSVSGNILTVYPSTTLYLYKDSEYRVVIPAGAVTDLGGSGKNEEIVLNYIGSYEREVSSDDKVLFSEDFSAGLGSQFMFYDGDKLTPSAEMQDYSFTAQTTPWQYVGDSTTDPYQAAMSHSSYNPAGQSDDWMVTPSIYIPDETCYLQFKSQGFRKYKQDHLKVYIIPSTKNYNTLTSAAMEDLKANKILVYDEVQDPGENEETMAGDWTDNEISLAEYAGKDIYIAFVNDNYDQSIVFVDDVEVIHDMRYLVALDNETTVVAQNSIDIFGRIAVQSEVAEYNDAHLELIDSDGNIIDTINETGLKINKDNTYKFAFSKPLPLTVGKEVEFTMNLKLGDDQYTIKRTITNVAFSTTKRVVLEEYAGTSCGNCPLGMLAMERLQKELPNNFIPICVRTYGSDIYGSGLESYSQFLGLDAVGAPSANINRTYVAYPATQNSTGKYVFNAPEGSSSGLWSDYVHSELDTPAIADIEISAAVNYDTEQIDVPVSVTYALDKDDVNVSVFFVVTENGLLADQENYFYNVSDDALGEWGKGGKYGEDYVFDIPADHVARALIGTTFNGTQGYVPSSVTAGVANTSNTSFSIPQRVSNLDNAHIVAMLIDNNTDHVINAAQCQLVTAGVNDIAADSANINVNTDVDGNVTINSDTQASVVVYNLAGSVIGQANGKGNITANTNGYKGVALVRVATANNTIVKKLVIK